MPGCARRTRVICAACAPVIEAVASSQCSAIQRRRVMVSVVVPFSTSLSLPQKHQGGRFERPPLSVAFLLVEPLLLLLRGLLYGFLSCLLRGCLLGCFLSCHLPILPFRWVASILQ